MQRTNLALAGVLALAILAAAVALFVATPQAPPPVAGEPRELVQVPARGQKNKMRKRLNVKGLKLRALRAQGVTFQSPEEKANVVQRELTPTGPVPEGDRIVIVTWDTVRADHVSAYGYSRQTTPNFDTLAAEGLLFENFIVPQSTTLPMHVSMFTGVHPDEHGVTANSAAGKRRFVPPEKLAPLARHLTDAGYLTAGFVSSTPLKAHSGIAEGFQVWSEPHRRSRNAADTVAAALTWLESAPEDRPFLLWIHHYDPHHPYQFPQGYESLFPDQPPNDWLRERGMLHEREHLSERLIGRINAYDAEIRYVDDHLEPILKVLEGRGWSDDTVVVVAGDHGEGLGQHDHIEHGLVFEEQLRAPLAVRAPGVEPERISTLTTAQDILPILAAVGDLPGEPDLLSAVSGRNVLADRGDRSVLSRMSRRQMRDLKGEGGNKVMSWSLRTATHHFIYREDGEHELFDVTKDPHGLKNIASEQPELVSELSAQVEAVNALHAKRSVELGAGETEPLDDETLEDLKALGYLD